MTHSVTSVVRAQGMSGCHLCVRAGIEAVRSIVRAWCGSISGSCFSGDILPVVSGLTSTWAAVGLWGFFVLVLLTTCFVSARNPSTW